MYSKNTKHFLYAIQLEILNLIIFFVEKYQFKIFLRNVITGKSLSEALIFASTNPQYDNRLFIELQVQYMKIPSSNLGRTCCVQKFFLTFRTIFEHNIFSPCSAKRRASDKDLPVRKYDFTIIFIECIGIICSQPIQFSPQIYLKIMTR